MRGAISFSHLHVFLLNLHNTNAGKETGNRHSVFLLDFFHMIDVGLMKNRCGINVPLDIGGNVCYNVYANMREGETAVSLCKETQLFLKS